MEHIEEAGVHSGDSSCALPPITLGRGILTQVRRSTELIAHGVGVLGLLNVQFALHGETLYVLEANPRASRTVPFVSKATAVPLAKAAARIMLGATIKDLRDEGLLRASRDGGSTPDSAPIAIKEAVLPFKRFRTPAGKGVDSLLGPEMKSTGEVMGIDHSFAVAFAKSQIGGGSGLPREGTVFVSVRDADKPRILEAMRLLSSLGFQVIATGGTQRYLVAEGIKAEKVNKVAEGRPHIVDAIRNGGVQLVFNTTEGAIALADSRSLRRAALLHKVPYYTTLSGAVAAAQGIRANLAGDLQVRALQSYFDGKP
jgi:carbamoyl-phosphate synthase large subunit